MSTKTICLTLGLLAMVGSLRAEFHTFTDLNGRTLKAEILSATSMRVKIKREDGMIFEVLNQTFVLDDRKYIEKWIEDQKAQIPLKLMVSVSQFKKTLERNNDLSSTSKVQEAGYNILIKNDTNVPAENLSVKYRVFILEDRVGMNNTDRPLKRITGDAKIDVIDRFQQSEVKTDTIKMTTHQLKDNWVYVSGADKKTADSLAGVWLRVYDKDGNQLEEYASSEKLKQQGW